MDLLSPNEEPEELLSPDDDGDEAYPLLPVQDLSENLPDIYSDESAPFESAPEEPPDFIRSQTLERSLPHNAEAEAAILGSIIVNNELISEAVEMLRPEDFYVPAHRKIFSAMLSLFERNSLITAILIGEEISKEATIESIGGLSFIIGLTYLVMPTTSIAHYAKVVRGKALSRQMIAYHSKGLQETLAQEDDSEVILEHAHHDLYQLADSRGKDSSATVGEIIDGVMIIARENAGHGVLVTGLATGLIDLDAILGGLQKQHLILIAARPSMGKSALATCIAENVGIDYEKVVLICSYEMSKEELGTRMACSRARVDSKRLRDGVLSNNEWAALGVAGEELRPANITIHDEFSTSTLGIRAKARSLLAKYKRLDLIVVDYLQLMPNSGRGKRSDSREREVANISRELKGVAKDLDVPLIALSQLNRKPEERPNKRPQLSDLRESGGLENDADVVAFIYREAYYQEQMQQEITKPYHAEIIVAKARSGDTGVAHVRFEKRITRFENLSGQDDLGNTSEGGSIN